MSPKSNATAHTIPMVNKTLELIRLISEDNEETTTKSLAICLGLPRSSCYRILRSLVAQDWIRPVAGGRHELSLGLLPVLQSLRRFETLVEACDSVIRSLALTTQMTVKVTVRQGDDAITISRSESPRGTSVGVRVGAAFPLAYGSSGAVLLSDLPDDQVTAIVGRAHDVCWERQTRKDVSLRVREVRSKGWCADFGMYRSNCHALSAAIHDPHGGVVAALTVIGFSDEMTTEDPVELSVVVAAAARLAEQALSNGSRNQVANHALRPLQSLSR